MAPASPLRPTRGARASRPARAGGPSVGDGGVAPGGAGGVGQAGRNNGAILIVAPNEREVRIEVGYGLEGELTDAISSVIIQGSILQRFRAGDLPGGIRSGAGGMGGVVATAVGR